MPASNTALPIIRPITDMRTKFNEVCAQATEEGEPIVLTKNGTASYVFMDSKTYEAERQSNRVRMALREAEIEEKYRPDIVSSEESAHSIAEIFSLMGVEYARA